MGCACLVAAGTVAAPAGIEMGGATGAGGGGACVVLDCAVGDCVMSDGGATAASSVGVTGATLVLSAGATVPATWLICGATAIVLPIAAIISEAEAPGCPLLIGAILVVLVPGSDCVFGAVACCTVCANCGLTDCNCCASWSVVTPAGSAPLD